MLFDSALYTVLHNNLEEVMTHLEECISPYMVARSFKEKPSSPECSGSGIFGPIVTVFYEWVTTSNLTEPASLIISRQVFVAIQERAFDVQTPRSLHLEVWFMGRRMG